MTTHHLKIFAPLEAQQPRGAVWGAAAAVSIGQGLRWLTRRLHGPTLAPVRPAPRDRTREAASVRALADSYRRTDPRFAADLYAAADRHEQIDGD